MYIGTLFWAIFLIILIFGFMSYRAGPQWQYGPYGNWIIYVLIFLLGWAEFGFILQGGGARHPF
jgi:hypothetical protein